MGKWSSLYLFSNMTTITQESVFSLSTKKYSQTSYKKIFLLQNIFRKEKKYKNIDSILEKIGVYAYDTWKKTTTSINHDAIRFSSFGI